MKTFSLTAITVLLITVCLAQPPNQRDIIRWQQQAGQVEIVRDNWGIPHVYGKTDADAVFGLLYAQCEDDFPRVEANYIEKLGRRAEVHGESELYNDLLIRLVLDSNEAKQDFANAPEWLKKLCYGFADGINYYLYKHPEVKPVLLTRFEPWWPLLWTDGSIGAINTGGASVRELENFYTTKETAYTPPIILGDDNDIGSNGFAFSPNLTQSGNAILYINPHVTFYFRPEVHIVSEEGLNAYGAVTWGQFFIYQGFNEFCGWMHTSSRADVADLYAEKINRSTDKLTYEYDGKQRSVTVKTISVGVKKGSDIIEKKFDAYFTHHGPVIANRNGSWLTLKHHNRSMGGLIQSWQRTKAKSFQEFKKVMYLKENTSNNTVYADAAGNTAYWHGNFMPKRNTTYDWSKPVDGTTSKTEWGSLHMVDDMVTIYNPKTGWIQNCNSTPATAAGESSLYLAKFPRYMAPDEENFRGINAVQQCLKILPKSMDIDKAIALGYTRRLPAMEYVVPALLRALKSTVLSNTKHKQLHDLLAAWNFESDTNSVATTLAIETAERMQPAISRTESNIMNDKGFVGKLITYSDKATELELMQLLDATCEDLEKRVGTWQVSWGEINRYQRLTGNIRQSYDDNASSIPVRFAAATWGALPSYVSSQMKGTNKRYGYSGNSFICSVEFGKTIKAKSLIAGGNSNNPSSKAFGNQAAMYANGTFKDVLFYKADIDQHTEKKYRPGE